MHRPVQQRRARMVCRMLPWVIARYPLTALLLGCVAPASTEASGEGGDGEGEQRCPVSAGALHAETPVPGWPGSVVDMLADLSGAVDCAWSGSHGATEANHAVLEMVHGGARSLLESTGERPGRKGIAVPV